MPREQTVGNEPDRLSGLMIDFWDKRRKGILTDDHFALFVQKKNPFAGVTRRELLVRLKRAKVRIFKNDPDQANFDAENDGPIEICRTLTPDQVDAIFSGFGTEAPWGCTLAQQGKVFTGVETLETLRLYKEKRGCLPRQDDFWVLRCSDPFGSGSSLRVYWSPGYGLLVDCVDVQSSYADIGAFSGE